MNNFFVTQKSGMKRLSPPIAMPFNPLVITASGNSLDTQWVSEEAVPVLIQPMLMTWHFLGFKDRV